MNIIITIIVLLSTIIMITIMIIAIITILLQMTICVNVNGSKTVHSSENLAICCVWEAKL